jgi:hypothetical protein
MSCEITRRHACRAGLVEAWAERLLVQGGHAAAEVSGLEGVAVFELDGSECMRQFSTRRLKVGRD